MLILHIRIVWYWHYHPCSLYQTCLVHDTGTGLQSRRSSIRQSQVLPVHSTIQKAIREKPWALHYHSTGRLTLLYSSPSRFHVHSSSRLPHLPTQTGHSQYHTELDTTSSTTGWSRWWTGVQDFWDPQLQGWQLMQIMQVTLLDTMVWLQGNWQRNLLATCHWTRQCYGTVRKLPCPVPGQTQTTHIHVVLLLPPFLSHLLSIFSLWLAISLSQFTFFINFTRPGLDHLLWHTAARFLLLLFIDPKFVLRPSLRTPHCSRWPHNSLIKASWIWPLKGGYYYDHVQLRVLSRLQLLWLHCSPIAQLWLLSVTPVTVTQLYSC